MARTELRLGTRGSPLALWQAHAAADRLAAGGGPPCTIVPIKTSGDRLQEAPLGEAGGKRLFVKEIEDALLRGDIDLAVHSSKDLPAVLPDGLAIAAVLPREDPRDAVVLPRRPAGAASAAGGASSIEEIAAALGPSATIGTGSVRRVAQLTRAFPGAVFEAVRGNLDTRLRKLDAGTYDALVLAAAGLYRLGFAARIALALDPDVCMPAPGQGIIAIEIRDDDARVRERVARIDDPAAAAALAAERSLVAALGGGCQTPIGALARPALDDEASLELSGLVISLDGARSLRQRARGPRHDPGGLGRRVAEALLEAGAADILDEARHRQGAGEGLQP